MTAAADLLTRLKVAREDLGVGPGRATVPMDLYVNEVDLLIEALQRPEVRQSCASTSNYPIMAERALRLIARNGIRDGGGIELIDHLVDCAGLDYATAAVEGDDAVPF